MFKNKSIPIVFLLTGLLSIGFARAQESVNAAGGDATGSGGTVAYSIGQVVYTTNTGTTGKVEQGVQHAFEIYSFGINATPLNISLTVFPNPTTNHLNLQISEYNNENWSYQLLDMQGKIISNGKILAQQTQIDMNNIASASYIVNVVNQENKIIQSFKIIKN